MKFEDEDDKINDEVKGLIKADYLVIQLKKCILFRQGYHEFIKRIKYSQFSKLKHQLKIESFKYLSEVVCHLNEYGSQLNRTSVNQDITSEQIKKIGFAFCQKGFQTEEILKEMKFEICLGIDYQNCRFLMSLNLYLKYMKIKQNEAEAISNLVGQMTLLNSLCIYLSETKITMTDLMTIAQEIACSKSIIYVTLFAEYNYFSGKQIQKPILELDKCKTLKYLKIYLNHNNFGSTYLGKCLRNVKSLNTLIIFISQNSEMTNIQFSIIKRSGLKNKRLVKFSLL